MPGQIEKAVASKQDNTPVVSPKQVLTTMLEKNKQAVGASLPSGMSVDRFVRLLLTAANTNPGLLACTPQSFLAAGVTAAQLGLEPNDPRGLAYLIPYNDNKRGKVVNFIIGYKGMLDLARRSGLVSSINAFAVYEGDKFEYRLGLDPHLEHVPAEDCDEDPAKLTHVYAVAKVNGEPQFVVMTRRQIDKVKSSSQSARSNFSPWHTHYAEMALKTALRRLCKWLPQTVEMAKADALDDRALRLSPDVLGDGLSSGVQVDPEDDGIMDAEVVDDPA